MTTLKIEDADIIFNGDKRGRQYLLINTDGLSKFDVAALNPDSPYAPIRNLLDGNAEYQQFEEDTIILLDTYVRNTNPTNAATNPTERYTQSITNLISTLDPASHTNLNTFITSLDAKLSGIYAPGLTPVGDLPASTETKTSFDALDSHISTTLKDAWQKYKITTLSTTNMGLVSTDVAAVTAPFASANKDGKVVKLGERYYKIETNGNLTELKLDNKTCTNYGLNNGVNGNNCENVLYECLVDGSKDKLKSCIATLGNTMTNANVDDNELKNMHPEIVLALLHRFGFKAVKDANGKKKIVSVAYWKTKILPKLNIDGSATGIGPDVDTYLQKLVDYVNFNEEILNTKTMGQNDLYDPVTKQDRFGKSVDPAVTKKVAIEGLTRFYSSRRAASLQPSNTNNFIKELYDRYDLQVPVYLQMGGAVAVDMLKSSLDNGSSGHKYLKSVWTALLNSVSNIELDTRSIKLVDDEFDKLNQAQLEIVKYFEFMSKVSDTYDLFKYAPTKVKITGKDVTELQTNFDGLVADYKDKEDKVAKLIEMLAKKEVDPDEINTAFD
jgi:hypothetical protein